MTKSFSGKAVLHGVSFEVRKGSALGLLGRNGAGKTTSMRIIMDVFRANQGEILIDGKPFEPKKFQIGYLPEERGLYPKRLVSEQMIYLAKLRGLSTAQAKIQTKKWLKRLELEEYENKKLETLSKGNQQKVQLASTLVCDPDIIILDEPFSGLDPVNSQMLKDVVSEMIEQDKLVIFSSHQMSYVEEFCDQIAIIDAGKVILSGRLRDIKKEYGKNRLLLAAENDSLDQVQAVIEKQLRELVAVDGRTKEALILSPKEGTDRKRILNALANTDIVIEYFGMYAPSLNDIFVEATTSANNI
ncbi:MAG: ATP-binding cassette domain-containing protein [Lachnospiraceae bacterium]|nr:ATP-binding cassette domain-containing protein [Lachnospiraceae bacterium]